MSRIEIYHNDHRCKGCTLPPRWCICEQQRLLPCELQVDVLIHSREAERPTSTGHLIKRVISGSRHHVWRAGHALDPDQIRVPGRELWILHPNGEEMPAPPPPAQVQVLLIDGSWKQATAMMKTLPGWGRRVRLPLQGESRFWLRNQQGPGQFSTAEALLHLMGALDMRETRDAFELQFELHVYAVLCARGEKKDAADYLRNSPVAAAFPELVAKLSHCRLDEHPEDRIRRAQRLAPPSGDATPNDGTAPEQSA